MFVVEGICLGMSGVDRPDDKQVVLAWMKEVLPKATASITNDAVVALASGTGGNLHGIVVISGTGTIALGYKNGEGPKRAQGWGSDRYLTPLCFTGLFD
jgi:N-acetylglucosamine kinase-like BadF-type ATPase